MRIGAAAGCALGVVLAGAPAAAFELLDGRLRLNGFVEQQLKGVARDFDGSDDWDLAQSWTVLDLEVEWQVAPSGFGPFSLVSLFGRIEGRYDCMWVRCGIFRPVDTYGDRAQHLPEHLIDARRDGFTGTLFTGDTRRFAGVPPDQLGFAFKDEPNRDPRRPLEFFQIPGFSSFLALSNQETAQQVFARFDDCVFAARRIPGPVDGQDAETLGPWNPRCRLRPIGALADQTDPLTLAPGFELPYRPAADPARGSSGLFRPNAALARMLEQGEFDDDELDQNFSQADLAWNHGASQQDEKELEELYLDLELFQGRLWLRLGKQNIVWGKTELFRTTDQLNPQDLGLTTLPSLEESRIALWSARGSWSFFDVGPLEDVAFEVAVNYDEFEPNDVGDCGEPFVVPLVCSQKSFGAFAHGITGAALAGEVRPPDPWHGWSGIEAGARLEFRWDRFSFALSDFYGYEDLGFADPIFFYERNVDPRSGRPRETERSGACTDGSEPACLEAADALELQPANQTIFALVCGATVGFSDLDENACGTTIFNSQAQLLPGIAFASLASALFAGNEGAQLLAQVQVGVPIPHVLLNEDVNDGPGSGPFGSSGPTLGSALTDEQEALLGCGAFFATDCDLQGIDLLNAEASALFQSWPGFEGTLGDWDATDPNVAQPGTEGFVGGPLCTRFENGQSFVLPGCRGPGDPGYDPNVDGTNAELLHPLTGQQFENEMGALSFNLLTTLVALSTGSDPDDPIDGFDPSDPYGDDCSFANPELCSAVQGFFSLTGVQRTTVRAGGNGRFGRRSFIWHQGGDAALRYEKRNVLGFAMDFAEDRTQTNWGVETTWIEGLPVPDDDAGDGLATVDTYNLTISVDRPTLVGFLNRGRTFFVNSQWFLQYVDGYANGFRGPGPWNLLGTLTLQTGYFRDRLLPALTFVYDFRSNSGAVLPEIAYRVSDALSFTFGVSSFFGRFEPKTAPLRDFDPATNRVGRRADRQFVENGLSALRDLDNVFLRVRYAF